LTWLCEPDTCPGLFYGTSAQDGFLIRLRVAGGLLEQKQMETIAELMENCGQDSIQVTNRANLQLRGVKSAPSPEIYRRLQEVGLAGKEPKLDHLRNVMTSPTMGIDPSELIDTRPLVQDILNYIENSPQLVQLSPKFSIGIDGGGQVAIGTRSPLGWEHRYNEIQLSATEKYGGIFFDLALGGDKQLLPTGILIEPENCIPLLTALTTVYLDYLSQNQGQKKSRLKHLLQDWGLTKYLAQVKAQLTCPFRQEEDITLPPSLPYGHLGIHPQKQEGFSYLGVSLILGNLTLSQWQKLREIARVFATGDLRLTPWQSLILPNLPTAKIEAILPYFAEIGLSCEVSQPQGAIVACAGKPGCQSALTQTQVHGRSLIEELHQKIKLTKPVNIHLTGCPKSCAQPSPAEITLLGTMIEKDGQMVEGYKIYLEDQKQIAELPLAEISPLLVKLITCSQSS
jgi:ferredoxin-nitrite reductase